MYGTRNTVVGLKDKSKISMCLVLGVKLFLVFNDQNWTGQKKKKRTGQTRYVCVKRVFVIVSAHPCIKICMFTPTLAKVGEQWEGNKAYYWLSGPPTVVYLVAQGAAPGRRALGKVSQGTEGSLKLTHAYVVIQSVPELLLSKD